MPHARPTLAWFAAGLLAGLALPPRADAQVQAERLVPARPVARATATTTGPQAPAARGPLTFERCWEELQKTDAEAIRALLWMAHRPEESVAFLKDKLRPLALDEEQARYLIRRLGAKDEKVWKQAFDQLDYLDPRLGLDLPTMLNDLTDELARSRLGALIVTRDPQTFEGKRVSLQKYNNPGNRTGFILQFQGDDGMNSFLAEGDVVKLTPSATFKTRWNRLVRSVLLLESIGSPEALAILRDVASGDPRAQPTRVAREAIDRLAAAK